VLQLVLQVALVSVLRSLNHPFKLRLACISTLSIKRHLQLLSYRYSLNQSAAPTVRLKFSLRLRFRLATLFKS
jgi:hypothetical protein